jgi:hypothetical protein
MVIHPWRAAERAFKEVPLNSLSNVNFTQYNRAGVLGRAGP